VFALRDALLWPIWIPPACTSAIWTILRVHARSRRGRVHRLGFHLGLALFEQAAAQVFGGEGDRRRNDAGPVACDLRLRQHDLEQLAHGRVIAGLPCPARQRMRQFVYELPADGGGSFIINIFRDSLKDRLSRGGSLYVFNRLSLTP
jgi:hypothetical protein